MAKISHQTIYLIPPHSYYWKQSKSELLCDLRLIYLLIFGHSMEGQSVPSQLIESCRTNSWLDTNSTGIQMHGILPHLLNVGIMLYFQSNFVTIEAHDAHVCSTCS